MKIPDPAPVLDALTAAASRAPLATALGTAELRALGDGILSRSVFTARGTSIIYATKIKEVVDALAAGEIGHADARLTLMETLQALGYTPEGGFPDAPAGSVPPALRGTLLDLGSFRRLDLIVRTQDDLTRGAGEQFRAFTPERLEAAPAFEFVRFIPKRAPRHWSPNDDSKDPEEPRWIIAGGTLYGGRMIALKGDPVWGELGSSANFDDALDVDYPPFAINSGMWWREVPRAECIQLGVKGPNGETIDEFLAGVERPRVMSGQLPLPLPSLSMADVDPALLEEFEKDTKATPSQDNPDIYDFSDLLEESVGAATKAYEDRKKRRSA